MLKNTTEKTAIVIDRYSGNASTKDTSQLRYSKGN